MSIYAILPAQPKHEFYFSPVRASVFKGNVAAYETWSAKALAGIGAETPIDAAMNDIV